MKKATISFVLVLAMCVAMFIPAAASDVGTEASRIRELSEYVGTEEAQVIVAEIEAMKAYVWADLYRQLELQDALDGIEYFKAALLPEIESTVYSKHGIIMQDAEIPGMDEYTYDFPDGGVVVYDGALNTENFVLCMNPEETHEYFYQSTLLEDLLVAVIGFCPIGFLAGVERIVLSSMAKSQIEDAGFYAKIMYTSWGSGAESACYGYGWTERPECTVFAESITGVYYG